MYQFNLLNTFKMVLFYAYTTGHWPAKTCLNVFKAHIALSRTVGLSLFSPTICSDKAMTLSLPHVLIPDTLVLCKSGLLYCHSFMCLALLQYNPPHIHHYTADSHDLTNVICICNVLSVLMLLF